jgi:hypothetical protein
MDERARERFKLFIYQSNGLAFQDLFVRTMMHRYPEFRPVKSHGSDGDGGNDGWFPDCGGYYQVYGPEDLAKQTKYAVRKVNDDIKKVVENWDDSVKVKEWYFVVNDKYHGVGMEIQKAVISAKEEYGLERAEIFGAQQLEDELFQLPQDVIRLLLGVGNTHADVVEDIRRVSNFISRVYPCCACLSNHLDLGYYFPRSVFNLIETWKDQDARIVLPDELSAAKPIYDSQIELGRTLASFYEIVSNVIEADNPRYEIVGNDYKLWFHRYHPQRGPIVDARRKEMSLLVETLDEHYEKVATYIYSEPSRRPIGAVQNYSVEPVQRDRTGGWSWPQKY